MRYIFLLYMTVLLSWMGLLMVSSYQAQDAAPKGLGGSKELACAVFKMVVDIHAVVERKK